MFLVWTKIGDAALVITVKASAAKPSQQKTGHFTSMCCPPCFRLSRFALPLPSYATDLSHSLPPMPTVLDTLLLEFRTDVICFAASVAVTLAYYALHGMRVRRDPSYSIHYINGLARKAWVRHVMTTPGTDVMAVQTLRNFIMNGILMVSTTALLMIGVLTL